MTNQLVLSTFGTVFLLFILRLICIGWFWVVWPCRQSQVSHFEPILI